MKRIVLDQGFFNADTNTLRNHLHWLRKLSPQMIILHSKKNIIKSIQTNIKHISFCPSHLLLQLHLQLSHKQPIYTFNLLSELSKICLSYYLKANQMQVQQFIKNEAGISMFKTINLYVDDMMDQLEKWLDIDGIGRWIEQIWFRDYEQAIRRISEMRSHQVLKPILLKLTKNNFPDKQSLKNLCKKYKNTFQILFQTYLKVNQKEKEILLQIIDNDWSMVTSDVTEWLIPQIPNCAQIILKGLSIKFNKRLADQFIDKVKQMKPYKTILLDNIDKYPLEFILKLSEIPGIFQIWGQGFFNTIQAAYQYICYPKKSLPEYQTYIKLNYYKNCFLPALLNLYVELPGFTKVLPNPFVCIYGMFDMFYQQLPRKNYWFTKMCKDRIILSAGGQEQHSRMRWVETTCRKLIQTHKVEGKQVKKCIVHMKDREQLTYLHTLSYLFPVEMQLKQMIDYGPRFLRSIYDLLKQSEMSKEHINHYKDIQHKIEHNMIGLMNNVICNHQWNQEELLIIEKLWNHYSGQLKLNSIRAIFKSVISCSNKSLCWKMHRQCKEQLEKKCNVASNLTFYLGLFQTSFDSEFDQICKIKPQILSLLYQQEEWTQIHLKLFLLLQKQNKVLDVLQSILLNVKYTGIRIQNQYTIRALALQSWFEKGGDVVVLGLVSLDSNFHFRLLLFDGLLEHLPSNNYKYLIILTQLMQDPQKSLCSYSQAYLKQILHLMHEKGKLFKQMVIYSTQEMLEICSNIKDNVYVVRVIKSWLSFNDVAECVMAWDGSWYVGCKYVQNITQFYVSGRLDKKLEQIGQSYRKHGNIICLLQSMSKLLFRKIVRRLK